MNVKRVGIVGAGPGGLAAIKACLEEGLEPTAFEREEELGGVWVYRDVDKMRYPETAAVYKCLKTNTSKAFFGFTDFPSPAEWPPFVSHDKVLKYLENYAIHFGLSKYIRFQSEVVKLSPVDDYETTGRWRLRYLSLGKEHEEIFDAVIICSGFYSKPNFPQYPGLELFKGDVIPGNTYRENTKFADKKVLVVGKY
ncbi:Dimethylaniline monooxygenase [N-oxide-forming] 1 [Holothuria leucospilota]|uniref:Flavin-containing monooxygenase n=1 Tax=Holothuria leucospilota TaxID=206669 RepID=A0A9Q0YHT5_HOLLE|nr:Dimethylaniline monooxygenase [N-oxide-forming] 1 [Holothuria leucospilota]